MIQQGKFKIQELDPPDNSKVTEMFMDLPLNQKKLHLTYFQQLVDAQEQEEKLLDEIKFLDEQERQFFTQAFELVKSFNQMKKNQLEKFSIECYDFDYASAKRKQLQHSQSQKKQNNDSEDQLNQSSQEKKKELTLDIHKQPEPQDYILNKKEEIVMKLKKFQIIDGNEESKFTMQLYLGSQNQKEEEQFSYKYNYGIGGQEIGILNSGKMLVNSNIINAYANFLMYEDENYYFSLNKKERQQHKRLFIFKSDFITDCSIDRTNGNLKLAKIKQLYVWLKYLEDFKSIQYQFWLVYKKIGFIVNVNNFHWYFIQANIDENQLTIYDSLKKDRSTSYQNVLELLNYLFGEITRKKSFQFDCLISNLFLQQNDGSSCGYFTCIAAEYLNQQSKGKMKTLEEMRKILKDLLLPQVGYNQ